MIESFLQRQLAPIVERHEAIHRSRARAAALLVGAGLVLLFWWVMRSGQEIGAWWFWGPVLGGLGTWVFCRWVLSPKSLDLREVARDIEDANPELRALLLTAVEEEERAGGQKLNYLHSLFGRPKAVSFGSLPLYH